MSENQTNELCKAFVLGKTIEDISVIEEIPVEQVRQILNDNPEKIQELKQFYKTLGVI